MTAAPSVLTVGARSTPGEQNRTHRSQEGRREPRPLLGTTSSRKPSCRPLDSSAAVKHAMRGRDEEPSRRESAAAAEELGDRAGFGWHDERGQRGRTRDGEEGDVVVAHVGIFGERAAGNREKETVDVVGERAAGSREKERATATVLMRIETAKMRWRFFFVFIFYPLRLWTRAANTSFFYGHIS